MNNWQSIIEDINYRLSNAPVQKANRWQSRDVSDNDNLNTHEILNYSFEVCMTGWPLAHLQETIKPNLPWADRHFLRERVSGDPINPGHEWRNWPYAASADTHRDTVFDHSYAERYWPKYAGMTPGGNLLVNPQMAPHKGIRFEYGDLEDLIQIMLADPHTRQAYLPVWFPEDLAAARQSRRVPCTLGYHFIMRNDKLHAVYYIRSCDYIRHFRDDVYMTIRLAQWILQQLKLADLNWSEIQLGSFTMHITSLHIFHSDYKVMFK